MKNWFKNLSELNRRRVAVAAALALGLIASLVVLNNIDSPEDGDAPKFKKSYDLGNRKRLPTEYYTQVYLWKACAINAGILGFLLVSSPAWVGWLRRKGDTPEEEKTPPVRPSRRAWIILGAGLLIALSLRLPLMERPLLFDEQDNLRRSFHGYVDVRADGEHWVGATWLRTFFENRQANNPPLFGVISRACVDIWRAVTGNPKEVFNLWIMRLPSLVAGMLSIFVIWRFLHRLRMPLAAATAVFFFALHPLAVDYSTQARGYGFVMLFASLSLLCGYRAVTEGTWKMWIAYACSQAAMMWSYPGSLYLPVAMNSALGIWFLLRWIRRNDRAGLTKLVLANVLTVMIVLQVMLPVLVQAKEFLDVKFAKAELRLEWGLMMWNGVLAGKNVPGPEWWNAAPDGERDIGAFVADTYLPEMPLLAISVFLLIPALVILGLRSLRKTDSLALLLISAGLASPFLSVLHHKFITGLWLYHWYVIFVLPFLFTVVAAGLTSVRLRHKAAPVIVSTAFLLFFTAAVGTSIPKLPGSVNKNRPDVTEISRPGFLFKITKESRMTRHKAPKE